MFKIKTLTIGIVSLLFYNSALASPINEQINAFIASKFSEKPVMMRIDYLQGEPHLRCENPRLELTNTKKLWGKITLLAQCNTEKQFIQLNIKVIGNYVAATRPIPAGTLLTSGDVHYKKGRLDSLNDSVVLDTSGAIDHVTITNIRENQPIKRIMLRKKWAITAGETTPVILRGQGYQVVTTGKSLGNASLEDHVNVKIISSGKIINGLVTKEGVIVFNKN